MTVGVGVELLWPCYLVIPTVDNLAGVGGSHNVVVLARLRLLSDIESVFSDMRWGACQRDLTRGHRHINGLVLGQRNLNPRKLTSGLEKRTL
jgi:hypothetical protein